MTPQLGFTLQPDAEFLALCRPLLDHVDYFELAPETTWKDREGVLSPNGFHREFLRLGAETGCTFVAHGVGLSLGSVHMDARRAAWLERIERDHALFAFAWYSDHLGVTAVDGLNLGLPIALPMSDVSAHAVRESLRALQSIVPRVGVENTAAHFLLGSPLDEPAFLHACTAQPGMHVVLDLHNVYTVACNLGFAPDAYLARLDLSRVIELHLSGGADSDPAWLPSGRSLRLDGHSGAVPEAVWQLYEDIVGRCPNLRGVTLERMEGTVTQAEVPLVREELLRARRPLRRKAA